MTKQTTIVVTGALRVKLFWLPKEGLHIPISLDMAISQMKVGKAPGPSGIVVEMIQAAGDMGTSMIRDFTAAVISHGKVPCDWEQSFIVCLYKGKGDALERGNYRDLKLSWRGLWTASSDS